MPFATDIDYTMLKRDQSALKQRNDYSNIYSSVYSMPGNNIYVSPADIKFEARP